jgi:hypothetical protein
MAYGATSDKLVMAATSASVRRNTGRLLVRDRIIFYLLVGFDYRFGGTAAPGK